MEKIREEWLIMLPHAGGSINIFKRWNKNIDCNVLSIEYPGHWTRIKEPLINSFYDLAEEILKTIKRKIPKNSKIYLFGHSIGAIMSWHIASFLEKDGFSVKGLFLSGSQNPKAFPEKAIMEVSSDDHLLKLIGYNEEKYEKSINNHFFKILLPIIKNDLEVCKSFISKDYYLNIKSFVFYGLGDSFVDIKEVEKWENFVKVRAMYGFPGGHMFIENEENMLKITRVINNIINEKEI